MDVLLRWISQGDVSCVFSVSVLTKSYADFLYLVFLVKGRRLCTNKIYVFNECEYEELEEVVAETGTEPLIA